MPNKASAKKRLRQTLKKTTENKNRKTRIKTFVKKVEQATEFVPSDPQPTRPPATQGVQVVQPEVDEIPF